LRHRFTGIAERLGVGCPNELASQLAVLINGAFVSSQMLEAGEAIPILRQAAHALVSVAQAIERRP
jgi:hypothetical protein